MELILLIVIAVVVGYFLAKSRVSKPIDDTAGKVASTSKDVAGKTGGWFKRTFGRKEKPSEAVVDATATTPAEPQPAAKQPSRRKNGEDAGTPGETA